MSIRRFIIFIMLILSILFTIAGHVNAEEGDKVLLSTEIEGMIKEYLVSNTPWREEQIKIRNINVSNKMVLPEKWSYHITPAPRSSMIGRSAFLLDITNEDNSVQSSWISADIEVWVDVVLLAKPLKEKQIVDAADVYLGRKELSKLPAGYIDDIKNAVGKMVKRFAGTNSMLTENLLQDPPVFKRGDKVFIVAESEALKVTAAGVAGEDGYRGRPARIMNMQSRKEIIGEVLDTGTVSVKW